MFDRVRSWWALLLFPPLAIRIADLLLHLAQLRSAQDAIEKYDFSGPEDGQLYRIWAWPGLARVMKEMDHG